MKTESSAFIEMASREAHRLAQKTSLTMMLIIGVMCHFIQALQTIAGPDEIMMTVIFGALTYQLAVVIWKPIIVTRGDWGEDVFEYISS